ncbi:MAG TPA: virulence factor [Anaerolineales bacterium]
MTVTYQIVYWRDIPAQIRLRSPQGRISRPLSPRFQEAIDAAAMRAHATSTDDYLEDWRTGDTQSREGDAQQVADSVADEIEAAYPQDRLLGLAANGGLEK